MTKIPNALNHAAYQPSTGNTYWVYAKDKSQVLQAVVDYFKLDITTLIVTH